MSNNKGGATEDLVDLIYAYNTIFNWQCPVVNGKSDCTIDPNPIVTDESNIVERILNQFSEAYKEYSAAYLGYSEYTDPKKYYSIDLEYPENQPKSDTGRSMTIDQILNSQFMVNIGENGKIKNYFISIVGSL